MKTPKLTHSRLIEALIYDPIEGEFRNRITRHGLAKEGQRAGSLNSHGYLQIDIDGEKLYGHHLAWFYMTKMWPPSQLDHKDTDRSNNRWDNLRLATAGQSQANQGLSVTNTSGVKGVRLTKNKTYSATISFKDKSMRIGTYKTIEEASEAYKNKAVELFGEFANTTNSPSITPDPRRH